MSNPRIHSGLNQAQDTTAAPADSSAACQVPAPLSALSRALLAVLTVNCLELYTCVPKFQVNATLCKNKASMYGGRAEILPCISFLTL